MWLISTASSRNKLDDGCMAWTNEEADRWYCDYPKYNDVLASDAGFKDGYYGVKNCFGHVTSFAVLFQLGGSNFGTGGPSDVLWIISVVLVVSIPVLIVLTVYIGLRFNSFRKFVYGYDKDKSLEETLKKLERASSTDRE
eukprot:TRINITY_DN3972_c0_g1_i2.p1 TRINITY_DN3972_c0_g1~~TRINITY_DN3972_c0_g1_i2.p1  ORF type:complete len:140 (-),score=22.44 TRINITY_DN3972_c0_g1_i2:53-472(-)